MHSYAPFPFAFQGPWERMEYPLVEFLPVVETVYSRLLKENTPEEARRKAWDEVLELYGEGAGRVKAAEEKRIAEKKKKEEEEEKRYQEKRAAEVAKYYEKCRKLFNDIMHKEFPPPTDPSQRRVYEAAMDLVFAWAKEEYRHTALEQCLGGAAAQRKVFHRFRQAANLPESATEMQAVRKLFDEYMQEKFPPPAKFNTAYNVAMNETFKYFTDRENRSDYTLRELLQRSMTREDLFEYFRQVKKGK